MKNTETERVKDDKEARNRAVAMVQNATRFIIVADMGDQEWGVGQFSLNNLEAVGVAQMAINSFLSDGLEEGERLHKDRAKQ